MTPGQRRAFHAKVGMLDTLLGQPNGTAKKRYLGQLGLTSASELTETRAADLLDEIERELAATR